MAHAAHTIDARHLQLHAGAEMCDFRPVKISDIESTYGTKFPAHLAERYNKQDGEEESAYPWRFNSLAEMKDCGLPDMLDHGEGEYVLSMGPVLPVLTNDASDLLVLHVGGPLDGMLSLVLHDAGDIELAFRSLDSFLKARDEERYKKHKGDAAWFGYTSATTPNADDKKAAQRLTAFHEATDEDNADAGSEFYERALAMLSGS